MTSQQFVGTIQRKIKDFLPDDYKDATIKIFLKKRLNDQYTVMMIKKKDQDLAPIIDLDFFYWCYKSGKVSFYNILKEIASNIQKETSFSNDIQDILMDYNKVKNRLFIRVSNLEKNRTLLNEVPYKIFKNLIITYHILLNQTQERGIPSIILKNYMLDTYGITQEQLHEDAIRNTQVLFPPVIVSSYDIIKKFNPMVISDKTEEEKLIMESMSLFIVTNEQNINGAAVIFYPGMMEKIAEMLGGNYFIIPSSIHEVLVHPDDGYTSAFMLKNIIEEVNTDGVIPEERLSYNVYYYDMQKKEFKKYF